MIDFLGRLVLLGLTDSPSGLVRLILYSPGETCRPRPMGDLEEVIEYEGYAVYNWQYMSTHVRRTDVKLPSVFLI